MEQRTEVAVATELSPVKRALGVVVLLGGVVLFSWLMAGTAHADAPDRPAQAEHGRGAGHGLGIAEGASSSGSAPGNEPAPQRTQPEKQAPAPSQTRPTAPLEDQVVKTGQQVREVTRPVTRAVTETLDGTPVSPVTRAVTDTAGKTVQKVVSEVRSTLGSTPVDPVLDVTDGVARDLSGSRPAEPAGSVESATLVDESPTLAGERVASDDRRAEPVPDPERRAAPPPPPPGAVSDALAQALDRSGETAPEQLPSAPTDPNGFAPPGAQSGAASPTAPGAAADAGSAALDHRSADHAVSTDLLVRVGGPSYEPGCSPD